MLLAQRTFSLWHLACWHATLDIGAAANRGKLMGPLAATPFQIGVCGDGRRGASQVAKAVRASGRLASSRLG
jgi:hypothetical protein